MKYKLLALDIDGTIVKEHTNIPSEGVVRAIKKASKKLHISLVSARAWQDEEIIIDKLGLREFYHVAENGTKVINPQGELEYNKHIPVREVQQIIDATAEFFDDIGFCIDSRWRSEYLSPEKEIVSVLSLASSSREKAEKIPKALKKLSRKYTVITGAHWSNPSWAVTLISRRNTSKGAGLRYIQKKLNISPNQTIAVGDGVSDVYTMQYAQEKVAMGNAEPELKKIATYVAPSLSQDGLVEAINKFIFFSDYAS